MGFPSHGSLKATEWDLLYKVYIPFLIISQQMSLDEHQSTNTQRNMGQSEDLENELTKNTFHLISAINIATSWTVSNNDAYAFSEHWKKLGLSNQHLFPKQKSKPNHHFADYIPELFQCWGPAQASATWGYEHLIVVFAKMPTNNKIYDLDEPLLQHISQCSNLSVLLKSPSVPCEIKQLFESQPPAPFNHQKHNKPSRHDQENYDFLVEYLQNFHSTREIVEWISLDTTIQSTSHPTSRIVSPCYSPVSNINIGNNIFSTESGNVSNSVTCFLRGNSQSFGVINSIFEVSEPSCMLKNNFLILKTFKVDVSFLPDWPHLNIYKAVGFDDGKLIISEEEIEGNCGLYDNKAMSCGLLVMIKQLFHDI
ncbi:hypothetical protein O181_031114 [Austropuccinia psidii MF-1]|uniref:Uncharacterized protein n=1 Tax=Austropuccinia psidii MF-1 TaxID=1389203 RepID=A0A9Q3CU77_9BASI|nr:hypothetical protein [Austropuccinia psidii MF-1]